MMIKRILINVTIMVLFGMPVYPLNQDINSNPQISKDINCQIQGGMLVLGQDQFVKDNSIADTIGYFQDTIRLSNYEGMPLVGLSFDLISYGKIVMTTLAFNSTFSADKWSITTSIHRGPILEDGSSIDTIHAVLLSLGSDSINTSDNCMIAAFGYFTVDIDTVVDTTSIQLHNIEGAAADQFGWPIDAELNTSDDQRITISNLKTVIISHEKGWNLVSVPVLPGTFNADTLFEGKTGTMFAFNTSSQSYVTALILNNGPGYWVNYSSAGSKAITGFSISGGSVITARAGWVLLGSMSNPVLVSSLVTEPAGAIIGDIWRYDPLLREYEAATIINPGEAVWIIVNQACTIKFP